jgi:hypothetical protein
MKRITTLILAASLGLATAVLAVETSHWSHTTEADFKAGTFHNVVATNLGDLKLSRATKTLVAQDAHVSSVNVMAEAPDGTIYAGTSPEGVLLAIKDGKATHAADIGDNTLILSLLIDAQGRVLVGTGGEKGQVFRIDKPGDKPTELFSEDGVQYVWALRQTSDGMLYAATGPNGQLFQISPDGKHEAIFDSDQNNLMCMTGDGKDLLYVGTDPDGLVYRINRKTKDVFVMYDAAESEISSLVLDAKGNLYAASAEASEQQGTDEEKGATDKIGRPEGQQQNVPIQSEPPNMPEPTPPPAPGPGEPRPIPKNAPKHDDNVETRAGHPLQRVALASDSTLAREPLHLLIEPLPADDPNDDPHANPPPGPNPPGGAKDPNNPNEPPKNIAQAANGARGHAALNAASASKGAQQPGPKGNAIYKIDKDGFVTELFRAPVIVYSLVEQHGVLLAGTGSEGVLYQVNPAAEETAVLAKVDPKEIVSLLAAKNGQVYLGLANSGEVASMSSGYAAEGTYTSPVLDATQISRFGKMQLHGSLPKNTTLTVATRSANVNETTDVGWGKWSEETPAIEYLPVTSPSARFLQYRLTFKSEDGKDTPVVNDVDIAYQVPNLAPQIKSVKLAKAGAPEASSESTPGAVNAAASGAHSPSTPAQPESKLTITWEATDPNNDALQYSVFFRTGARGDWIQLKEKLTEATFEWDTRSVADGRYEVKVVASDAAANPRGQGKTASRISDPVVVDNTPPVIGDVQANVDGAAAKISLRVVDRTSTVAMLDYAVDSSTDWQAVLPSDTIADSPEEAYAFTVPALQPGPHQITLRAADAHGNRAFQTVTVTVAPPTAAR